VPFCWHIEIMNRAARARSCHSLTRVYYSPTIHSWSIDPLNWRSNAKPALFGKKDLLRFLLHNCFTMLPLRTENLRLWLICNKLQRKTSPYTRKKTSTSRVVCCGCSFPCQWAKEIYLLAEGDGMNCCYVGWYSNFDFVKCLQLLNWFIF